MNSTYYAVLLALVLGVGCGESKEKTTPKAEPKVEAKKSEQVNELKRRAGENRFDHEIQQAAVAYGIAPALIKAVVWRESRFNPKARGSAGKIGLMQLREIAAREWAEANGVRGFQNEHLLNPHTNLLAGTWYLKKWRDRSPHPDDPLPFALAAYNAGPTKAREWARSDNSTGNFINRIDYPSTKEYVLTILQRQVEFQKMFDTKPTK